MPLLSDVDISRELRSHHLIIEPFSEKNLTPVGYDVRVGRWVASLTTGKVLPEERFRGAHNRTGFWVPAHERVLVISMESIRTSRRIGGTFHTMVTLASRGLSPISTTLDPGWSGVLFITVTNLTDHPIFLEKGEPLTTLVLYYVRREATKQKLDESLKLSQIIERLALEAGLSEQLSDALLSAELTVEEIKDAERKQRILTSKKASADRWHAIRLVAGVIMIIGLLALIVLAVLTSNGDNRTNVVVALISAMVTVALAFVLFKDDN